MNLLSQVIPPKYQVDDCAIKRAPGLLKSRWLDVVPIITAPRAPFDVHDAEELLALGFVPTLNKDVYSRTPSTFQRMDCLDCRACIPARMVLQRFNADTKEFRKLRCKNDTLRAWFYDERSDPENLSGDHEIHDLYERYMFSRFNVSKEDSNTPDRMAFYDAFPGMTTAYTKFTLHDRLIGCCVVHIGKTSAYGSMQFYDMTCRQQEIGHFMVTEMALRLKQMGLKHLYLGNWAAGTAYSWKEKFTPLELYTKGRWNLCETGADVHKTRNSSVSFQP